jgi:hypothetical protein
MIRLNYRQGLVTYQQYSGVPTYLQPSNTSGFISHIISPTPTIATFAHGSSDYLVKFDTTIPNAWRYISGISTYLYWDIDVLTGAVSRGTTTLIPIVSAEEPASAQHDQHWFNLAKNVMFVWNADTGIWMFKIRLFAGVVQNGNQNTIKMYNAGSQIGLNTPSTPGYILLDTLLRPLRKNSEFCEFLTDGDTVHALSSAGTSGVLVQPAARVLTVRAAERIPEMSAVCFSANDEISLATSIESIPARIPVGLCLEPVTRGQLCRLVIEGEITYDQWAWGENHAGSVIYADQFGTLTLTRPSSDILYRIGYVKNHNTILLNITVEGGGSGSFDSTIIDDALDGKSNIGHMHSISDVIGLQTALDGKSNVGHTHGISDINGLQDALDDRVRVAGDTMTGPLILAADPTQDLEAATKHYVDLAITDSNSNNSYTAGTGVIINGTEISIGQDVSTIAEVTFKKVTATEFFGGGNDITNLNGSNITTGLINPARLGTGTAALNTVLRGNGTWGSFSTGAAGSDMQIQYNNGAGLAASDAFTFNYLANTLSFGRDGLPNAVIRTNNAVLTGAAADLLIQTGDGTAGNVGGGTLSLVAGNGTGVLPAGHINIQAGSLLSGTGLAGNVSIKAGSGQNPGYFSISTGLNFIERFRITGSGSWSIGDDGISTGAAGELLVSNGPNLPPSWSAAALVPSLPENQIGYGNASNNMVGTDNFTFDDSSNTISLGSGVSLAAQGTIKVKSTIVSGPVPTLTLQAGDNSAAQAGHVYVKGGAGATGGSVYLQGGNATASSPAGSINLSAGTGSAPGSITFSTAGAYRLSINPVGAWLVNSTAGTSGYVLTSNGSYSPPTWQAIPAPAAPPYDIGLSYTGVALAGHVSCFTANRGFTLVANLTGSYARATTAPAGTTTFNIYKKASTTVEAIIGTVTFVPGSTIGTFSFASAVTFSAGDMLILNLPTADTALADVGVTFAATNVS